MEAKKYLYAAVGAPVTAAKSTQSRVEEIRTKIEENLKSFGEDAHKRIEDWSKTGESTVGKITETKTIDDLTTRVDFDQVQTQVHKLRDQLEDLVSTWRSNFRPATEAAATPVAAPVKAESKKPATKTPAAKKPATKAPAAKTAAAKKPAAKKPASQEASHQEASRQEASHHESFLSTPTTQGKPTRAPLRGPRGICAVFSLADFDSG